LKFKCVKPRKARFVNEAAEETKPTAEDVDTIIDGLVDATAINAQQADELRDAVADSADLDKLSTKAELAEQIAEVADDLGIDVDLDDCLSMVNESAAGDDVVDALLKDKTAADFDVTTVEIDGRTSTAIVTKDGQLTGIELEGEATETTVAELQSLLNKYLATVNTDESLTMFKKAFKRINVDEAKLPSMFDTAGFVIAAPAAQQIDCIGNPPAAYKVIVESLTDDQVDLLKRQAGIREFVNESDVLSFYRSRNWSQIKQYSKSGKVGFVNEASIAATGFTPEQLDLIRAIKG
jgi:polyhydroxyalkanoate synthesis regulator phasin